MSSIAVNGETKRTILSGRSGFRCLCLVPRNFCPVPHNEALRSAVITAYRQTLMERYSEDFVRRVPGLEAQANGISDETIRALREFFLEHLYPTPQTRRKLDDAFDRMKDVITSPRRMFALLGTAGRSLFKLGSMIPSAISAGMHTLEAVHEIRKLEGLMVGRAEAGGISAESVLEPDTFADLVRALPEKEIVHFRKEMNKLFKHLSNLKLLDATIEILEDSRERMKQRADLFTEAELAGISLGLEVMRSGVALFRSLTPDQVDAVHSGVNAIEVRWYESLTGQLSPDLT